MQDIDIGVIMGSVRPGRYTGMAAAVVAEALRRRGARVEMVDAAEMTLPLPGRPELKDVGTLNAKVGRADGLVFVTPEYHGSYSSVMKLVLDNLDVSAHLSGKPAVLVGVAAGRFGAVKALEHLRSVLSHVGMVVLPAAVSVGDCRAVFDRQGRCRDDQLQERLEGLAERLVDYLRGR